MKKYIKIIFCLLVSTQIFTACDDTFLEEEVLSDYAPSTLTDLPGFEASLIGLYNLNSTFYSVADRQGWPAVWQVGTDVVWPIQPQGIETPYYDYTKLTPLDEAAGRTWNWAYAMINNTNIIINNIETLELDNISQEDKSRINAEARFFRALAYNYLSTLFGGVPIITEPLNSPKTDFVRAPLNEVNEQIRIDLDSAATYLPNISELPAAKQGRANKHMAHQLLAELYLRTGEYAKAEEHADIIITSGEFQLVNERYGIKANEPGDPFSDMFIYGNQRRSQGNTEAIWVMEAENPRDIPGGMTGAPQQRRVWQASYHSKPGLVPADSLGGRGIARIRLNDWVLYDLYEDGDMRNSQHNIRREYYYNDPDWADPEHASHHLYGTKVPYEGPDTLFIIAPYTTKWGHFDPQDVFGWGMWKDFILMRLGETYLLRAEAELMQNKPGEAAATINVLRERANAPLVDAAEIDLNFILDERVRELIGEENRRMTLMRTKTLVDRAKRLNDDAPINPIIGLTDTHLLLPIPDQEIRLNKDAELTQNPGYTK